MGLSKVLLSLARLLLVSLIICWLSSLIERYRVRILNYGKGVPYFSIPSGARTTWHPDLMPKTEFKGSLCGTLYPVLPLSSLTHGRNRVAGWTPSSPSAVY